MRLVLAVEPDAKQAEALRRMLGRQDDTELIVVTSAYAATSMMKRRVPDLVLLGASLGSKSREIVDIYCLVSDAPQTLQIPPLGTATARSRGRRAGSWEPASDLEVFAAEVAACLARAADQRHQAHKPEVSVQAPDPPQGAHDASAIAPVEELAPESATEPVSSNASEKTDAPYDNNDRGQAVVSGFSRTNDVQGSGVASHPSTPPPPGDESSILINLDAPSDDAPIDPQVYAAHLALVQARAEARLASELERVRREADEQRAAELARLQEEADAQRRVAVDEARAAAATEARDALSAELVKIRTQAEETLAAELVRVRAEAGQRLAEQLAQADAARTAAVEEARLATEQAAAQALESEVARINAENEARLAEELRRVQGDSEQARRAQEDASRAQEQARHQMESERDAAAHEARVAAEEASARTVAAEIARVRQESDARLAAELARAHAEAEAARRAHRQAQLDFEAARKEAAREARAAAEAAAARALEAEVERVRADAEARLQQELARARVEVEQTREARERAQLEAAAARDAAVREALAAAEAAAAEAREVEIADVRAEADARLRAELVRVRSEAEHARARGDFDVEQIQRRAELDALALAKATEREIARARAEADARLAAEVAEVRADAERRRAAELAEMRAQLALVRKQARSAASATISEEVPRAEAATENAAARLARVGRRTAVAALRAGAATVRVAGRCGRAALPVVRATWRRLPARTVPAAAVLFLVGGAAAFVDVSTITNAVRSLAESTFATASDTFTRTTRAVRGALTSDEHPAAIEPSADAPVATKQQREALPGPAGSGILAVFSRVPLELYVSGRRIGTTDDGQILLPAGRYRVGLVNRRLNYRGEVTLNVRPAVVTSHTVSLPRGRLQVNTEPGAEVWVEGARAGVAPLEPLPVPIGTREVIVRHPDLGERREYVEIRYGEVVEVSINRRDTTDPAAASPLPRLGQPGPRIR